MGNLCSASFFSTEKDQFKNKAGEGLIWQIVIISLASLFILSRGCKCYKQHKLYQHPKGKVAQKKTVEIVEMARSFVKKYNSLPEYECPILVRCSNLVLSRPPRHRADRRPVPLQLNSNFLSLNLQRAKWRTGVAWEGGIDRIRNCIRRVGGNFTLKTC